MKSTLTKTAAAALLSAALVPAFAAINTIDDTAELFAIVVDESVGSYTLDLGITFADFVAGALTHGYTFSKATGPVYGSFSSADADPTDGSAFAGTRWMILAVDSEGFSAMDFHYLTTTNGGGAPGIDLTGFETGAASMGSNFVAGVSVLPTHSSTANGENFAAVGESAAFKEADWFGTFGLYAGNKIGETSPIYSLSSADGSTLDVIKFDGKASFDGTTFAYQSTAPLNPVPEPETYALMLAGLGALAVAARRRKR